VGVCHVSPTVSQARYWLTTCKRDKKRLVDVAAAEQHCITLQFWVQFTYDVVMLQTILVSAIAAYVIAYRSLWKVKTFLFCMRILGLLRSMQRMWVRRMALRLRVRSLSLRTHSPIWRTILSLT
jgi:hypothetical protein